MILDNSNSPELLRDVWPVSGTGSALITSRNPQTAAYLHSSKSIDLQLFGDMEASHMIQKLARIDDASPEDQEASIALSDRLTGYPLALVLIATIMSQKGLTPQKALELYDSEARLCGWIYKTLKYPIHMTDTSILSHRCGLQTTSMSIQTCCSIFCHSSTLTISMR